MRRNKYRNKITVIDGIRFHSQLEGHRYEQLRLLERTRKIKNLTLQPKFPLIVFGYKICTYVADFAYEVGDISVIEDAKGMVTDTFKIKWKMVNVLYGHKHRFMVWPASIAEKLKLPKQVKGTL